MISDHKMLAENFVAQSDTVFPVNGDEELTEAPRERHDYSVDCETHRPITNLRDIIRRVVPVFNYEYSSEEFISKEGVFVYPISDLLGITQDPQSSSYYGNVSSLLLSGDCFWEWMEALKLKSKYKVPTMHT
jgi:hypothetical protein